MFEPCVDGVAVLHDLVHAPDPSEDDLAPSRPSGRTTSRRTGRIVDRCNVCVILVDLSTRPLTTAALLRGRAVRLARFAEVMLARRVAVPQLTSNATRRVVGQWGGASGAICEDHLAFCGELLGLRRLDSGSQFFQLQKNNTDWCVDGVGAVLHAVDKTSRRDYLLSAATRRPGTTAAR